MERMSPNRHLNAALGYLGLGMAQEAWNELEQVDAEDRGKPDVLKVRVEVARALGKWELVAELARHLSKIEPDESLHVFNLAQALREIEGHESALAVYEFAADRWPDFGHLRVAMAVELCALDRASEAKVILREAIKRDPNLKPVVLDHPELEAVW